MDIAFPILVRYGGAGVLRPLHPVLSQIRRTIFLTDTLRSVEELRVREQLLIDQVFLNRDDRRLSAIAHV
jgi:hypothetical protein